MMKFAGEHETVEPLSRLDILRRDNRPGLAPVPDRISRRPPSDQYHFLVMGGGLFGSTYACRGTRMRKSCLVIERQLQVGGLQASINIGGVTVQKCGVHLFRTTKEANADLHLTHISTGRLLSTFFVSAMRGDLTAFFLSPLIQQLSIGFLRFFLR